MSRAGRGASRPNPRHAASRARWWRADPSRKHSRTGNTTRRPSPAVGDPAEPPRSSRREAQPSGAATHASGAATPGSIRHATARRHRRHTLLVSLLAIAMFFSSGIAWAYRDLDTNIETHSIDDLLGTDRKSTRLNSSHVAISYAVFCLKKK